MVVMPSLFQQLMTGQHPRGSTSRTLAASGFPADGGPFCKTPGCTLMAPIAHIRVGSTWPSYPETDRKEPDLMQDSKRWSPILCILVPFDIIGTLLPLPVDAIEAEGALAKTAIGVPLQEQS